MLQGLTVPPQSPTGPNIITAVPAADIPAAAPPSGSDDEELMTDDQMFQMDAVLAAAVGASVKSGGDAKQAAQQLLSFKQRVLGLVEICVKKVDIMSVPVMFRLLQFCFPGGGGLSD